nr:hypothetical protein [uncultured Duganella sp.]
MMSTSEAYWLFISAMLAFSCLSAVEAGEVDANAKMVSELKVKRAVQDFTECVLGRNVVVLGAGQEVCGVEAENRTELLGYLSCPRARGYRFQRALERAADHGRFLYSCSGQPDVVIKVNLKTYAVIGIGELLP